MPVLRVKTKINWKQLNEGENLINVDTCSNNKVLKEKYYVKRIIIRKQDPKKVRIFASITLFHQKMLPIMRKILLQILISKIEIKIKFADFHSMY